MKLLIKSLPFIILAIGASGMLAIASLRKPPSTDDEIDLTPKVLTEPVSLHTGGFDIDVDGEVVPFREIRLAAEVAGRVKLKSPKARAGGFVSKGDLLFEIDPRDYELEVKRLKETVNQASTSIEEADVEAANIEELIKLAKEELELQRKEVERAESLARNNAISDSQLERARRNEIQSLNSLQTLRNQSLLLRTRRNRLTQEKERALTALEQATINLERATVRSPIDGVVIMDSVEVDDYVQRGTLLVQIEDTSKVEVRFSLRMDDLRWIWSQPGALDSNGQSTGIDALSAPMNSVRRNLPSNYQLPPIEVTVHLELEGNRFTWPARLDRYDGAGLARATRTIPCIAVVDDPSASRRESVATDPLPLAGPPTLLRGMFVSVEIPVAKSIELLRISPLALRPGNQVWIEREGRLAIEKVRVADATSEDIFLLADPNRLSAGANVIVSPIADVRESIEIRPMQPDLQSETNAASPFRMER